MRHVRYVMLFLAAILESCLCGPSRAEDFPLVEYETHVARYLASIENIAVDFTATDQAFDGSVTFFDEYSLISITGNFRAKNTTRVTSKIDGQYSKIEWFVLRPDGHFIVSEKAEGQFLLKAMQKEITSPLLTERTTPVYLLMRPLHAGHYPINRLIRGEMKKTHSVNPKNFQRHSGKKDASFTFQSDNVTNGMKSETHYELNDRWLVTRVVIKSQGTGEQLKQEITYTMLGERLLPERVTTQIFEKSGRPAAPPAKLEFTNYRVYNGRLAEFSLAQFGLPETSSKYRGGSYWYLWFIAFAFISLGVGWYFRRRMTSGKPAPGPNSATGAEGSNA